jgi:hypothetical protein
MRSVDVLAKMLQKFEGEGSEAKGEKERGTFKASPTSDNGRVK